MGNEMEHKLICWGDYAIPISNEYKWMAWDKNGLVYTYTSEPHLMDKIWFKMGYGMISDDNTRDIPPPEPGPWNTQLYWIG